MMRTRRAAIALLGATAPWSWEASAQPAPQPPRIGVLWFASASDPFVGRHMAVFRQRLRELGFLEGKTILIDECHAAGSPQRLSELAHDLVAKKTDVIVASALAATRAARAASATIPIVMLHAGDPIGAGLITSLARPGGNITGTTNLPLFGKLVELMRELLPRIGKLALITNTSNAALRTGHAIAEETARGFNMSLMLADVSRDEDFAAAYARVRDARVDALLVFVDPLIGKHRAEVLEFAAGLRLPVGSDNGETTRAGGLASYGILFSEHYVLGADYVDKILKGAKPADLPVGQPTRFELIVNRQTARSLGLTIPRIVLLRADEVIQ